MAVYFLARAYFNQLAKVHNAYPVAYVAHHGKIVRYKKIGESELPLKILQHVYNLRLNGNIKRAYGLVAYYEFGIYRQRPCYTYALALAAAELMRITVGMFAHQPHTVKQFIHPLALFFLRFKVGMKIQSFAYYVHNGHARIERSIRVLEYHLHFFAVWQQFLFGKVAYILPVKDDFAVGRLIKPCYRAANGCFAAARFAYQPQRFVAHNVKGYVVNAFDYLLLLAEKSLRLIEILCQAFNLQQLITCHS